MPAIILRIEWQASEFGLVVQIKDLFYDIDIIPR